MDKNPLWGITEEEIKEAQEVFGKLKKDPLAYLDWEVGESFWSDNTAFSIRDAGVKEGKYYLDNVYFIRKVYQ